jgi:hypothetical protein
MGKRPISRIKDKWVDDGQLLGFCFCQVVIHDSHHIFKHPEGQQAVRGRSMLKKEVNISGISLKVDCIKEIDNLKAQLIIDETFLLQLDRLEIDGLLDFGGQISLKEFLADLRTVHHRPDITVMGGDFVLWHAHLLPDGTTSRDYSGLLMKGNRNLFRLSLDDKDYE